MTELSIVIATHNRAESLHATLQAISQCDLSGLAVNVVVADNNSTDETPRVARGQYAGLRIQYVFEARAGKNFALNAAVEQAELSDTVIFTDDDVTPSAQWLQHIAGSLRRWPDISVFGGPIRIDWPAPPPGWALEPRIQGWAFSHIHHGERERLWPDRRYPAGPNYWVRRSLFDRGYRFDERLGPRPDKRIMGDEATFLRKLSDDGYEILYVPGAEVAHRIQEGMLTVAGLHKRAQYVGRSAPYVRGVDRSALLQRSPVLWLVFQGASLSRYWVHYALLRLLPRNDRRVIKLSDAIRAYSGKVETIEVGWRSGGLWRMRGPRDA